MHLRLIIHAPTATALQRGRRNTANFRSENPDAEVELVIHGDAVRAALGEPDPHTDAHLVLCRIALERSGLEAPAGMRVVATASGHIARRQAQGWSYFRA